MPYCPTCREEFREGFTTCSDCGAALVAELPKTAASEAHDPSTWEQVAETAQIFEAELMAATIRGAGIEAQVVDQTFHQEPFTNRDFALVRVLVPPGRKEEARAALEAQVPLAEDADVGSGPPEESGPPEDESAT